MVFWSFSIYLLFLIFIFIKIEESIDNMKIIINTFSPIKELMIGSKGKTITSVKHKLICPTADKRSLSSLDSLIIFCIEVLIEVSYTFSKLSFNTLLKIEYSKINKSNYLHMGGGIYLNDNYLIYGATDLNYITPQLNEKIANFNSIIENTMN